MNFIFSYRLVGRKTLLLIVLLQLLVGTSIGFSQSTSFLPYFLYSAPELLHALPDALKSGAGTNPHLSCGEMALRLNAANINSGNSYAVRGMVVGDRCVIRINELIVLKEKVSLMDSYYPVDLIGTMEGAITTTGLTDQFDSYYSGEISYIPVSGEWIDNNWWPGLMRPTLAGKKGYNDKVFIELKTGSNINGVVIDHRELKSGPSGAVLPGILLYGISTATEIINMKILDIHEVPENKIKQHGKKMKGANNLTVKNMDKNSRGNKKNKGKKNTQNGTGGATGGGGKKPPKGGDREDTVPPDGSADEQEALLNNVLSLLKTIAKWGERANNRGTNKLLVQRIKKDFSKLNKENREKVMKNSDYATAVKYNWISSLEYLR